MVSTKVIHTYGHCFFFFFSSDPDLGLKSHHLTAKPVGFIFSHTFKLNVMTSGVINQF